MDRPGPAGTLTRAISRFEVGLERPTLLEAVSDYVLTLRCLLEGAGAADVGVPMRVAALCAEPAERPAVKDRIARAVELERALVRGELLVEEDGERPLELVAELEEGARLLLRMLARGELGADLRAAADEALLADGARSARAHRRARFHGRVGSNRAFSRGTCPRPGRPRTGSGGGDRH